MTVWRSRGVSAVVCGGRSIARPMREYRAPKRPGIVRDPPCTPLYAEHMVSLIPPENQKV